MNVCKICNSENTKKIKIGDTYFIRCNNCDIHFLDKIPSEEELVSYYSKNYIITSNDNLVTEQRRIFRIPEQIELLSIIQNYIKISDSILDIGCDKGFFLDEARRYGYSIAGVEPSIQSQKYCSNIGVKVLSSVAEVKTQFDAIVMWHSIEHQINPVNHLIEVYKLLKDEGYIFIRVPAFDCLWRKIFGKRWIWFQPKNHYFQYSVKSLQVLLSETGYEVVKIEHRYPNNRHTKKMNSLINSVFRKNFDFSTSFYNKFKRIYEDITGIELFAIAKKIKK